MSTTTTPETAAEAEVIDPVCGMTASLPKDCLRSGLASVPLAVVLDGSSTPQAPQILPVGAPALVVAFDTPLKAQSTAIPKALDGRRVETPLRI